MRTTNQRRGGEQESREYLYGVTEIDLSLIFLTTKETLSNNDELKQLSGWYHILNPKDSNKCLGQIRVICR